MSTEIDLPKGNKLWLAVKGSADKYLSAGITVCVAIWSAYLSAVITKDGDPLAWVGLMPTSSWVWAGAIVVLVVLWLIVVKRLQRPSYAKLVEIARDERARSSAKASALESTTKSLLRELSAHCSAHGANFRVSTYVFHGGRFVAVARHSSDPKLTLMKNGRSHQTDELGIVAEAWRKGEAVAQDLPADRDEWEEKVRERFGYSSKITKLFRMQSRSYAALRIDGPENPVGVLVFESLQPRGVGLKKTLNVAKGSRVLTVIQESICAHHELLPQVEALSTAGDRKTHSLNDSRPWRMVVREEIVLERTT